MKHGEKNNNIIIYIFFFIYTSIYENVVMDEESKIFWNFLSYVLPHLFNKIISYHFCSICIELAVINLKKNPLSVKTSYV